MTRRSLPVLSLVAVSGLALAGCASSGDADSASNDDGGKISIVASTSVYADLATKVVGDAADVSAIIDSPTVDPHDYEATAQDQLAVTEADLDIFNGGGYDSYMEKLVESGDVDDYIEGVEYNDDYPGDGNDLEGFNEHVWYDPATMLKVVDEIATKAGDLLPDDTDTFEANATKLKGEIQDVIGSLDEIASAHPGATVAFTEPVGLYFATAAGMKDVTAEGFAEAVEEGQEVPPATLLKATTALENGDVDVLVLNPQTAGPATDAVQKAADQGGVPVVEFTETVPDGDGYVSWMQANADALSDALAG